MDGGFVVGGNTKSFGAGNFDFWLIRVAANGDSLWSRTYGGSAEEECYAVVQTSDGGYALAGSTQSFGAGGKDVWLVRVDADGDSLWSRTYGGGNSDWCHALQQTDDGGFLLAATTYSYGAGGDDVWVIKTDADGDSLWSRTFGGTAAEESRSIIRTADANFAIGGFTESRGAGQRDYWLIKMNDAGDTLWSRTYGGIYGEMLAGLCQTPDGGYLLVGNTMSFGAIGTDAWVVKTDADGDSLWNHRLGGAGTDVYFSAVPGNAGGCVLAGYTESFGAQLTDYWLVGTDANGDTLWTRVFGGDNYEILRGMLRTSDGGLMLAGYTSSYGAGGQDVWLLKTSSELAADDPLILHPSSFSLSTYPNPFNPVTTIGFDVPVPANVRVTVFDLLGRNVATIVDERLVPGSYQRVWDASSLPSGMYWCRLEAGSFTATRKMLLLK